MIKNLLNRFKKDERGLTLVELLAVVVILAIVGAIAFVAIGNVMENSRKDAHVANAQQLISAAKLYEASVGEFPPGGFISTEEEHNTIETLTDPWGELKGTAYNGTVEKDGDVYSVTLTGGKDCTLTEVPESSITQGRDVACNH